MKCPFCGSTHLAPIIFGLPDYTEELVRRVENEEVYLGGCLIMDGYPQYHCFACGQNVGKRPVLRSRRGLEYYRCIVTGIHFRDDGFPQILMEKKDDHIRLEIRPACTDTEPVCERQPAYERLMSETEWDDLLNLLYTELYLHEWGGFFVSRSFPDGERWELTIKFTEDRKRIYRGIGGFQPYWEELKAAFRPFIEEAGIC